jgi:hypothetical protein
MTLAAKQIYYACYKISNFKRRNIAVNTTPNNLNMPFDVIQNHQIGTSCKGKINVKLWNIMVIRTNGRFSN